MLINQRGYINFAQLIRSDTIHTFPWKNKNRPPWYLEISGHYNNPLKKISQILQKIFEEVKNRKYKSGSFKTHYGMFWTPEEFQGETSLKGLFSNEHSNEINVKARVTTVDTSKPRIYIDPVDNTISDDKHRVHHTLEADLNGPILLLTATGRYIPRLSDFAQLFGCNETKDPLLPPLKAVEELAYLPPLGIAKREERAYCMKTYGPLDKISDFLRLIKENEKNSDSNYLKLLKLAQKELGNGIILSDLKRLVQNLPGIDLGIDYANPMITQDEARDFINSEIRALTHMANEGGDYINTFIGGIFCKGIIRLAREHFGDESDVMANLRKMTTRGYIGFLKSKGYQIPENIEKELSLFMKPFVKETHLLHFFIQSYGLNPRNSFDMYRRSYINDACNIDISSDVLWRDLADLRRVDLPERSRLYSFEIGKYDDKTEEGLVDWIYFPRLYGYDTRGNDSRFRLLFRLDNPELVSLQEYACREMGITFK